MRKWLCVICCALAGVTHAAPVPRILVALYDSREESSPRTTLIHRYLEMPANYLGYDVRYYDINAQLPAINDRTAGIVVWFNAGMEVPDAGAYLDWLDDATARSVHLVVLENFGLGDRWRRDPAAMEKAGRVLARIGVADTNRWQSLTYEVNILHADPEFTGFERAFGATLPPYMDTHAVGEGVSHLTLDVVQGRAHVLSDAVITSPHGGYAAAGYTLYRVTEGNSIKLSQWYLNPFAFLRATLEADALPKPDVTTLDGRRIFFAQFDSDGFNSLTTLPAYHKSRAINAEAIGKEIFAAHPDIPFTLGLTGAELDAQCYGLEKSADVARALLALPNVEAASHTFSHPLYWNFFADYSAKKEMPYRDLYPRKPRAEGSLLFALKDRWHAYTQAWKSAAHYETLPPPGRYDMPEQLLLRKYYRTPRSYACAPFDLRQEIAGNAARIQALLPAGKQVRLLDWTGDTAPFAAAIAATRQAGLMNLGGGNAQFHAAYPSYGSVAPIGIRLGDEVQLYAANGDEQGLTDTAAEEDASGIARFQLAARMEETPYRLRPLSFYAHIAAGNNAADLRMVQEALASVKSQPLLPLQAADYAAIAAGFYTLELETLGEERWQVNQRGALGTLRFDHAALKQVDFAHSSGVIGMRWAVGSLYVALDPQDPAPIVQLKALETLGDYPAAAKPYLIESNWRINRLQFANNSLTFTTQGYGDLRMQWRMPTRGRYSVHISQPGAAPITQVSDAEKGTLNLYLEHVTANTPVTVSIEAESDDKSVGRSVGVGSGGDRREPVPDPAHAGNRAHQL